MVVASWFPLGGSLYLYLSLSEPSERTPDRLEIPLPASTPHLKMVGQPRRGAGGEVEVLGGEERGRALAG